MARCAERYAFAGFSDFVSGRRQCSPSNHTGKQDVFHQALRHRTHRHASLIKNPSSGVPSVGWPMVVTSWWGVINWASRLCAFWKIVHDYLSRIAEDSHRKAVWSTRWKQRPFTQTRRNQTRWMRRTTGLGAEANWRSPAERGLHIATASRPAICQLVYPGTHFLGQIADNAHVPVLNVSYGVLPRISSWTQNGRKVPK